MKITGKHIDRMICDLASSRNILHAHWFLKLRGWSKRDTRDVASHSGGYIASSNKGYCLNTPSNRPMVNACIGRLRSQAKEMSERADDLERVRDAQ